MMGFLPWLKKQNKDQGPLGDLAKELPFDPCLPRKQGMGLKGYRDHLENTHRVNSNVIDTLESAWILWQGYKLNVRLAQVVNA